MPDRASLWLWWGAIVLLAINFLLFRLASSQSFRRRSRAGGRSPFGALVLFPAAATATVLGVVSDSDPGAWISLTLLVPLFGYTEYRRRQLAGAPDGTLSPATERWLEAPGLSELVRHPVGSTRANLTYLAGLWSDRGRERQWERDQGLR